MSSRQSLDHPVGERDRQHTAGLQPCCVKELAVSAFGAFLSTAAEYEHGRDVRSTGPPFASLKVNELFSPSSDATC
jgi:hypothetical protein